MRIDDMNPRDRRHKEEANLRKWLGIAPSQFDRDTDGCIMVPVGYRFPMGAIFLNEVKKGQKRKVQIKKRNAQGEEEQIELEELDEFEPTDTWTEKTERQPVKVEDFYEKKLSARDWQKAIHGSKLYEVVLKYGEIG